MFVTAKVKNDKKKERILVRGYYLIMMRPNDKPILGNNIRALIRHVNMVMMPNGALMGSVKIHYGATWEELDLTGNYGSNGFPISVRPEIWEIGAPLPDALYDLYQLAGSRLKGDREMPELVKWAQAVRKPDRLGGKCYRCAKNKAEPVLPCPHCWQEIKQKALAMIRMESDE